MTFICSTKGKNIVSLGIMLNKVWSFSAVKQINDADNKTKESSPKVSADKQSLRIPSRENLLLRHGNYQKRPEECLFIFVLFYI